MLKSGAPELRLAQRFPEILQPALTLLSSPRCAHKPKGMYTCVGVALSHIFVTNCLFLSYNFEFNIAVILMFSLRGNQLVTILEVSC